MNHTRNENWSRNRTDYSYRMIRATLMKVNLIAEVGCDIYNLDWNEGNIYEKLEF